MFVLQGEDDLIFEIMIPILNDNDVELEENFNLTISSPSLPMTISLAPSAGVVIIRDDDLLPPTATVIDPTVDTSTYFCNIMYLLHPFLFVYSYRCSYSCGHDFISNPYPRDRSSAGWRPTLQHITSHRTASLLLCPWKTWLSL